MLNLFIGMLIGATITVIAMSCVMIHEEEDEL